jgi:hypothetical protein
MAVPSIYGGYSVAKITIELDTEADKEIIALVARLIELLEKTRQAGK